MGGPGGRWEVSTRRSVSLCRLRRDQSAFVTKKLGAVLVEFREVGMHGRPHTLGMGRRGDVPALGCAAVEV